MKKLLASLFLLCVSPAFAADNAVIVTPGTGVTMKSKDIGAGVQAMQPILSDASGNALLTTVGADAVSNTLTGIPMYGRNLVFNGTTWDRWTGAVSISSGTVTTVSTVTNLSQMGGAAISMGTGARAAGTQRVTVATDDLVPVVGNVAAAATDSGNPVKIGGVNNTTLPTLTDGQRGNWQFDSRGAGFVVIKGSGNANAAAVNASADGVSNSNIALTTASFGAVYNGTTWDRLRGDATVGAYQSIRDAAGNARGANVDASNKLTVSDVTAQGSLATIATNTGSAVPLPTASGNATTGVTCGSAVSSCVLKASTGNLMSAYANCTSACWLMIFNSTTAPSNGATTAGQASGNLVHCIDISAGSSKSISFAMFPGNFSVGITAAISSTACATLTLSTVGFVHGEVL